ncbi:MAG: sel1 repeat family protein [Hyphomicrobiales bacterium]|nr:sel1 repeat family protein [Hyphomicrobiales bacterium]
MAPILCRFLSMIAIAVYMTAGPSHARAQNSFGQVDTNSTEAVESLKAYAAYKSGDFATAKERWLSLADRGNTSAMINLANMYDHGQGVEKDPKQGLVWLERAAALQDPRAQLQLGLAYENGDGVERDPRQAAQWFRQAAEQDDSEAQFNLGVMLATAYGAGLEQSSPQQRTEAVEWLEKAAAAGHPDAPAFLSTLEASK